MIFRSINVKVVSVIILILAASVTVSLFITVRNQRANLLDETRRNVRISSDILNSVIRNLMVSGESTIAQETLMDLKAVEEYTDIEIYKTDGTNAYSDTKTIELVNSFIGAKVFGSTERSPRRVIDTPEFDQVLRSNTPVEREIPAERMLEFYFPILNYAECRDCHGTEGFIRGVAHYKVSTEGIYSRISEARNILTLFFVITGLVISFLLILLIRRIVVTPLLSIGGTVSQVGTGNLGMRVSIRSKDELGTLATEINDMIEGLNEKSRLEIENSVIDARNQENRKYLDNIGEGLLLLDKNQVISDQYSSFLETLFGTGKVTGRVFSEFLYPDEPEDSEVRRELDQFIDLIFSGVSTEMEMIMSINPLQNKPIVLKEENGQREIIIDASYQRILSDNEVVNVMVIFQDRTDIVRIERQLETEKIRSETELEHIQAILRSGPQSFIDFASEADETLRHLDSGSDRLSDVSVVTSLFRDLHSLKGAARYMELRSFARILHETEDIIAAIRDGHRQIDTGLSRELNEKLEELYGEVENIKRINDRFKDFASHEGIQEAFSHSIRGLFENLERMSQEIAGGLDKQVRLRTSTDFDTLPFLTQLRDPIIHLIRNAIDHGIEEGLERISKRKEEAGSIEIRFRNPEPDICQIEVQDDGAGIDFDAVKRSAIEGGILKEKGGEISRSELLRVLFLPAFSSRSEVTDLSGRGVGLDVVHATVKALGGTISVASKKDQGTKVVIRIPLGGHGEQE